MNTAATEIEGNSECHCASCGIWRARMTPSMYYRGKTALSACPCVDEYWYPCSKCDDA